MTHDTYEAPAEFYELVTLDHWAEFRPRLVGMLKQIDHSNGVVIDVGAGTGLSTQAIADALPDAEILAIEPSAAMRVGLRTRLASDSRCRSRVSVLPSSFQDARLPQNVSAIVAISMFGHFSPEHRKAFWLRAGSALMRGGDVIIELQQPYVACDIPTMPMASGSLGRHRYEGWCAAERTGPDTMRWTMTYRASDEVGAVLADREFKTDWWPLEPAIAIEEASHAGFELVRNDDGLMLFRREAAGMAAPS